MAAGAVAEPGVDIAHKAARRAGAVAFVDKQAAVKRRRLWRRGHRHRRFGPAGRWCIAQLPAQVSHQRAQHQRRHRRHGHRQRRPRQLGRGQAKTDADGGALHLEGVGGQRAVDGQGVRPVHAGRAAKSQVDAAGLQHQRKALHIAHRDRRGIDGEAVYRHIKAPGAAGQAVGAVNIAQHHLGRRPITGLDVEVELGGAQLQSAVAHA